MSSLKAILGKSVISTTGRNPAVLIEDSSILLVDFIKNNGVDLFCIMYTTFHPPEAGPLLPEKKDLCVEAN
jgi:hypothetical protein